MIAAKRSTTRTVEELLAERPAGAVISIAELTGAVRAALPACELTDGELGDVIAMHAIALRRNICFDLSARARLNEGRAASAMPVSRSRG